MLISFFDFRSQLYRRYNKASSLICVPPSASKTMWKLLYGCCMDFIEICATKQQYLSSIFVPKICPENCVEAAVQISALGTVPLCCCMDLLKSLAAGLLLLTAKKFLPCFLSSSLNLLMKELMTFSYLFLL